MKKLKKLNNKGMTLIELIICIAIIAFIALGMAGIFLPGAQLSGKAAVLNRVNAKLVTQMELVASGAKKIDDANSEITEAGKYKIKIADDTTAADKCFGFEFGTYGTDDTITSPTVDDEGNPINFTGNLGGVVVDGYEKNGENAAGNDKTAQRLRIYLPKFE